MTSPDRVGHMFGFQDAADARDDITLDEIRAKAVSKWHSLIARGFAHIIESRELFVRGYVQGWLFQETIREHQYQLLTTSRGREQSHDEMGTQ